MHRIRAGIYVLQMQHPRIRHRLHEIEAGISDSICQTDIYLPVRSGLVESQRLRRVSQQNANHSGLSLRPDRISLADYVLYVIRMFYCMVFTFNAYTNQPSQLINPRDVAMLVLKEMGT